ncbi:MAG: hypothetical protein KDH89_11580, partial [Anaerolineae bacterium]|nr:hypothetical protein [Anaerolineae bacterium]
GNARLDGFANYRVEFGEGVNPASWTQIGPEHGNQVGEGTLEFWDTSGLNGLYSLRVLVTRGDGSVKEGVIQLTVDNTAPTVDIIAPVEGQRYVTEDDEWVSITADANDDWAMDRVDFYMDGAKIGTSTVPPFSRRWDLELIGQNTPQFITQTTTLDDGTVITETVPAGVRSIPEVNEEGQETGRSYTVYDNGFGFLVGPSNTYTETHLIQVKAYDRAGNETVSEPVRIFVARKVEEKKDNAVGLLPDLPGLPPPLYRPT